MLQPSFAKAPLLAVLGAVVVFVLVASAGMGLDWPLLLAAILAVVAASEGFVLWRLWQSNAVNERHLRQIRFVADRFQAMVRSMPAAYCLFTPQGLLREEYDLAPRLGVEKITHIDELIGAVKEGPELLEAFRKLQLTGDEFTMPISSLKDGKILHLVGRRFRVGADGPHVDILWFCDPVLSVSASTASAAPAAATSPPVKPTAQTLAQAAASATNVTTATPPASAQEASKSEEPAKKDDAPARAEKAAVCGTCFGALPFPVWGRAADLSLVLCNEAYARAVDTSVATALNEQYELASTTATNGSPRALASAALAAKEKQSERRHVVIEGRRRLLEIFEMPLETPQKIAGESSVALLGFAVDVTAEEEKDTELRRHLAAQHEVMEHLGTAISIYGPDTRLEFYNRAYQRMWESPEGFLDSKPTFGEVLEELRSRRKIPEQVDFQKYKKDRGALFTSLLEPQDDVMYLPDGTSLRILAVPHPLGGLMFVHENVTDQLALETSYNTLMAVQRETIDNLAEGIAVFGPDGKLRLSNPALTRLWKLPADFIGSEPHVSDVVEHAKDLLNYGDDWASYKADMVGYALDRNSRTGRIERPDHSVIEFLTVPLPDGSVLNSFLDVTDSVRVEQALRASNAALAQADRLKSDFVANVSYQLRTPLNTITGFAEILTEQYFGTLNERQLEYTNTIKAESDKLSRLINDVLDLATIEAGRMTLDRRPVAVANLLNTAKQMTAEWARQQSLEIIIDCPSDIGSFDIDEHRMKQVLFNLISNAIKYTPAGGHIALAAWKQDEWVVVSVLDTGVGIPESDRERVFGKFEKSNNHLRQSGAGLGLSLVKSFVELHGGRVEIFSDEKDGTRVSCFLPQKAPIKTDVVALSLGA